LVKLAPACHLHRLDNAQVLWLLPSASSFSDTSYPSLEVTGILPDPALATVFVNGIPSYSQPLVIRYPEIFLPLMPGMHAP
jgi:hypothetical protein